MLTSNNTQYDMQQLESQFCCESSVWRHVCEFVVFRKRNLFLLMLVLISAVIGFYIFSPDCWQKNSFAFGDRARACLVETFVSRLESDKVYLTGVFEVADYEVTASNRNEVGFLICSLAVERLRDFADASEYERLRISMVTRSGGVKGAVFLGRFNAFFDSSCSQLSRK